MWKFLQGANVIDEKYYPHIKERDYDNVNREATDLQKKISRFIKISENANEDAKRK